MLRNILLPSVHELPALLNEVLSLNAQESCDFAGGEVNPVVLNEVLSLNAQESREHPDANHSDIVLNEVLSLNAQEWEISQWL